MLADELSRVFPLSQSAIVAPGWVLCDYEPAGVAPAPAVVFADQCLPDPVVIAANSVSQWANNVATKLVDQLAHHAGPWRLHVFSVIRPGGTAGKRRCQLIRAAILENLKKKQRRLVRLLTSDPMAPLADDEALAQVALLDATSGYFSISPPQLCHHLRRCISPFCGGYVEIADDRRAPSRAYRKLLEAEIRMGRRIEAGQTCVDLGASPGGWSHVALGRGAIVTAVDRSPLRADLMRDRRLTFVKKDAFKFMPDEPVDWLFSDVIAYPPRVEELLDRWLSRHGCRQFCVTIKFKGTNDYPLLERIKALLADRAAEFWVRRLQSNKNEATAYGWTTTH